MAKISSRPDEIDYKQRAEELEISLDAYKGALDQTLFELEEAKIRQELGLPVVDCD